MNHQLNTCTLLILMVVGAIENLVMTIKISNYYHYIISGD